MSETIQQATQVNSVAGYDEAEGVTYDVQSVTQTEGASNTDTSEVLTEDNSTQEPEISIKNGEVNFSDDFFGDIKDEPSEEVYGHESEIQQQQKPNYYSDEELRNTPYNMWDFERLPDSVKPYANVVREQIMAQQRQQQAQQQVANNPEKPPYIEEVKDYSIDELSEAANKLACERLGIEDAEDFEPSFDDRHYTAREMAMRELLQKRNEQVANYKQQANDYQFLRQVNAEISTQPDFAEYQKWFTAEAAKEGKTPEQMNEALIQHAKTHGGDFRRIASVVAGWYQAFRYSKAQQAQQNNMTNFEPRQNKRAKTPPILESTQGGNKKAVNNGFNMRDFGELDTDAQAQALMDMGIV